MRRGREEKIVRKEEAIEREKRQSEREVEGRKKS